MLYSRILSVFLLISLTIGLSPDVALGQEAVEASQQDVLSVTAETDLHAASARALVVPDTEAERSEGATVDAEEEEAEPVVSVDVGVGIASRFIYRGINLGEAPQIQPRLSLRAGNFEASLWGSHPIAQPSDESIESPRDNNYREVLFWALYNIDVGIGTLTPYVQNHYNPNVGRLFNVENEGRGAHYLQSQLMFSGKEGLPFDVMIGWVFYNDPGDSVYLEGGYRFEVEELSFRAFMGGVPGRSPFNGVSNDIPAITNLGLTSMRTIRITEMISVPVSVSFIFNPYVEDAFAVFSVQLL